MNSLEKVFNGKELNISVVDGKPWFLLKDVCNLLGIANHRHVKQRLDDDVVSNYPIIDNIGRPQGATFVNEDGLYDVILDSKKPEAKAFRKWITSEVLPSIREHGGYQVLQTESEKRLQMLQIMSEQEKNLTALDKRVSKVEDSVRIDAGKQYILNKAIKSRVYKVHETMEDTCERKKLFSKIHRNFKEAFRVASYRDIRKLDFDDAMNWVSSWRPLN